MGDGNDAMNTTNTTKGEIMMELGIGSTLILIAVCSLLVAMFWEYEE